MWRIAGRSSRRDYWCIKQSSQPGRRRIFRLKSARSKQRIGAKRAQGGKIHRIQSSGVWPRINGSIICAQFSEKRLVDVVEGRLLRPLPIISSSSSFFVQWRHLLRERERVGKKIYKKMSRPRRLRTQVATPPAHQETRSVRKPESHRSAHIKGHPISGPHEISTPQALNFFALRGQGPPAILCFKKSVLWRRPVG